MKKTYITLTPIALVATMMMSQAYANHTVLDDVVVTASPMAAPVTVEMDPKVPRQPLPAHDGADFFKSVPGFSVMRKAGADGELSFRGMGGSRVNILVDDQNIFGGCGQRMDAPTAYIFPEIYDKVTVVKGPQTVLYPGNGSAATIRFEKEPKKYDKLGYDVHASGLIGSFGRHDEVIDASAGDKGYFVNFAASNSHSQDYKDGNGNKIYSQYTRHNEAVTFGLTPDDNKRFEVAALRSNGYAKYADRTADGQKFLRENIAGKTIIKNISDLVSQVEFQVSHNFVDHTMGRMMLMSVQSKTDSARLVSDLNLSSDLKAKVGADYSVMTHLNDGMPGNQVFNVDGEFKNIGLFGELTKKLSIKDSLVGGARLDSWRAYDNQGGSSTRGQSRNDLTKSGFARYESNLSAMSNAKAYVGVGLSERMLDFWELISASTGQQFQTLKTEKTKQLDLGVIQKTSSSLYSASVFYNKITDYALISWMEHSNPMMGWVTNGTANINATTYGGEVSIVEYLAPKLKGGFTLSYTHGTNDTDHKPLAQIAPLESKLSLSYEEGKFTHGGVLRLVTSQDRYDANKGGIAGFDIGKTGGFGIFSLNTTYKHDKRTSLSAGVDNLFDKSYAEFISRRSSSVAGYAPSVRVNEPGRTAWLKATIALD